MSRSDTIVNTLLGILLLLAFFAYLAAFGLVAWLGFIAVDWALHRVLPSVTHPADLALIGVWALSMVWAGVGHFLNGRSRNAFLQFALTPIMGWAVAVILGLSNRGTGGHWAFWLPILVVIAITGDADMGRLKFFLAAAIIAAVVSVNSGLLGNRAVSQAVADSAAAVAIAWLCMDIRARWRTQAPTAPLTPPTVRA